MQKIGMLLLLCMMALFSLGQDERNFVKNPSFESIGKVKKMGQINQASDWDSPTGKGADVFTGSKKGLPCSAPNNTYGREFAMDGENYAGVVMYSYNDKQPRTYLQTELISPLKKGVEYCVKYNVSLADLSKYACNNLSAILTKEGIGVEGKSNIVFEKEREFENVLYHPMNKMFNQRYNWETVCDVFKANGKEKYLTIGNFHNTKDTKYQKLKKVAGQMGQQKAFAYYYIDKVEVFMLDDPSECDCMQEGEDEMQKMSVIYRKQVTSEDGFTPAEKIKNATIYFDRLKAQIDASMLLDMNNLIDLLNENPSIKLELIGHSDKVEAEYAKNGGRFAAYANMGEKRVNKVKKFLVKGGVAADRLTTKWIPDSESVSGGESDLDKAKNQKVEFKLLQ